MIACVCPVHASHPFVVLPYQSAYCPVLSAPSFFVCRTEGVPVFVCQPPPILQQQLCSMLKLHGRFLPMFLGLLPTRYRVAFPSRSCNLTPKLLPCFMMGSVCPVHALYGPAPVEFDPFVKPHQPCTVISVLALPMICTRYVPGMYLIELFFPRARLVCCFPCVYLF